MISDPWPATVYDFAPAAEDGIAGATELVNAQYAAACHGVTSTLDRTEAVLLGYSPDAAFDDQTKIPRPKDALATNDDETR